MLRLTPDFEMLRLMCDFKTLRQTPDRRSVSKHFVDARRSPAKRNISQQTWSGFSPTTVPDNNRQSGFSPTTVPKLSTGFEIMGQVQDFKTMRQVLFSVTMRQRRAVRVSGLAMYIYCIA